MKRVFIPLLLALSLTVPVLGVCAQDAGVDKPGVLSAPSQVYFNKVLKDFRDTWVSRSERIKTKISLTATVLININNDGTATYNIYRSSLNPSFDKLAMECCKRTPLRKPPATWNKEHAVAITCSDKANYGSDKSDDNDFSAVDEYLKGLEAYNAKNLEQAAIHLKRAVELDPYLVVARANLAGTYSWLKQYQNAVDQFQEVLKLDPGNDASRWSLVLAYYRNGEIEQARKQASLIPPNSRYYSQAQEAMTALLNAQPKEVISDKVKEAITMYNQGVKLDLSNDVKGAVAYYEKAIALDPDYFLAHSALGNAYLKLGRQADAIAQARECLRIQPDSDDMKYLLGALLYAGGNTNEGLALLSAVKPGTNAYKNAQELLISAKAGTNNAATPSRQNQTTTETVISSGKNTPVKDKWALVIGISKFANPKYNLKYAAKDAQDFYNYLITEGHFKKDHVLLLLNENATRRNIMEAFGDKFLPAVCQKGDLVTIYVSTHGTPAGKDVGKCNYIVAYDTEVDSLFATGVDMDSLYEGVKKRVDTERVLIVMDTCFSGAGVPGARGLDEVANFDAAQIALGSGHLVMTSSSPSERSWESKVSPNGVFTKYLIQNLRLTNGNVKNSYDKLKDDVGWEVKNAFNQPQHPQIGGDWEGKELILNAVPVSPRPNLNPDLIRMINVQHSSNPANKTNK